MMQIVEFALSPEETLQFLYIYEKNLQLWSKSTCSYIETYIWYVPL